MNYEFISVEICRRSLNRAVLEGLREMHGIEDKRTFNIVLAAF